VKGKMDPTIEMMQRIKSEWGAAIDAACAASSVPAAFLAALIANESGGNAAATRYEPTVAGNLAAVIAGKKTAFDPPGSRRALGPVALSSYVSNPAATAVPGTAAVHHLSDLATSFGLTQIMGFHVLMWQVPEWTDIHEFFAVPSNQIKFTLQLLNFCAESNMLDLTIPDDQTAEEFFTWWNSGRVNGIPYDPQYISNGLERMKIYKGFADMTPAAQLK
jgi:hypothetical protein